MNKINRSVINMLSGGAGYVIPMLLNLIFTPLIVKNLGQEAYGLQSLVNVIIGYLMVSDMGLDIPVTKFISEYKAKEDQGSMYKLLNSTLQIYLIIGLSGMLVIVSLSHWLASSVFKVSPELYSDAFTVFILAGVGFLGGVVGMWGKSIFNGLQRYDIANGISIASNFISTIAGIILVINGFGVVTYVFVRVFCTLLSSIAYYYYSKKMLPFFKVTLGIDIAVWLLLKAQIGYGFILRISGFRIDQTLIGTWVGMAGAGVYAIPFLITSSLIALISSITHFVFPMASSLHATNKTEELKSLFLTSSRFVAAVSSLLFVPLILFGDKFLALWVGRQIGTQGDRILILLSIATYSSCLCNIIINVFLSGIGQLRIYTTWAISKSIILAIGCIFLIKPFGIEGAGIALLIACTADYIYFTYTIRTFLQITVFEVFVKSYAKTILLSVLLGSVAYFARPYCNGWFNLSAACILFTILFISIGFSINIFGKTEKNALAAIWNIATLKLKIKNQEGN